MVQRRLCVATLVIAALWLLGSVPVAMADARDPRVIDANVLLTGDMPEQPSGNALVVQATSLGGNRLYAGVGSAYILTIMNDTPWTLPALRVLDRYFPPDPTVPEVHTEWFPRALEPGEVASTVISLLDEPFVDACHQLEVTVADGLSSILMDCSAPGSTTVWQLPIDPDMAEYLDQPPLTLDAPIGPSKVGLHVTSNSSPAIMDYIRQARPAVVVSVGGLGWLTAVRDESPETITVARLLDTEQAMEGDPVERARSFVDARREAYLANPQVDYWLGWNEPSINSAEEMAWYASFEAERTRRTGEMGLRVAIGNFSVGVPEPQEFEPFLEAVAAAKEYGGVLSLHEYSAPTMRDGVGAGVPGVQLNDQYGALTLRYRIWYDHYLQPQDLVIPLIITESGIDGGVLAPQGLAMGGWRDVLAPAGEDASRRYIEQLSWYDDELRRDPYVLGFAVFNAGDPGGDWASFDVTDILADLAWMAMSK